MNGYEILKQLETKYPEEKPVVFNYATAREEVLSLAKKIVRLEALLCTATQNQK